MKSAPEISIIVPIYNVEDYLERAIKSVINQSFPDWELILVDDGSPDRCGEICDYYAEKDDRIRVIHQKNGGVSAARNAGIDMAEGAYLFCLDPDDYLPPEALETLLGIMRENGADLVVGGHNRVEADGRIHCDSDVWPALKDTAEIQKAILQNRLPNFVWGRLYCRTLWDGVRMPEGEVMEDLYVCPALYFRAKKIVVDRRPLYFYSHENAQSIMAVTGEKYVRLRYGKFLAWREHERIAKRYCPECAAECAEKALYAGVRAYCLDTGKGLLSTEEREKLFCYIKEHEKMPAAAKIRWMRQLILHGRILLPLVGALQRALVDYQQGRRQKRMRRKMRARSAVKDTGGKES